jgi:pimeloyl-ACP methyl ester carboxylesterase
MLQIELSAGTIEYTDTGGGGPVIVLLHGLLMDATLWDEVTAALSSGHRCVAPTLPLGAHRRAMKVGADLSLPGIAKLVAEFLGRLGLDDVTLVGNDTGGAVVQLLAADGAPGVGRVVLASCDAFDNFPPGLTGRTLTLTGKLPPTLFGLVMQQMRLRPLRRLPVAFGWLTRRGDAATARWIKPVLTQPDVRRETTRMLRAVFADKRLLLRAAESLHAFDRPALVIWAADDRVMPPEHGRRLAGLLADAHLLEIPDSYTLIPLDQPAQLAEAIREFASPGGGEEDRQCP